MTLRDLIDAARVAGHDPEDLELEFCDLKKVGTALIYSGTISFGVHAADPQDFDVFDAVVNDGEGIVWPKE